MPKVLIISPYFPPSNAADMQRIRMSLTYFKQFGWEAEVVAVADKYSESQKDGLLLQSIPEGIKIHYVKAWDKKRTSKFGLGSLALRSMWYYRQMVSQLLKTNKFDLIYFSTTQFPLCILGAYWKRKFGTPYIIDMQDPWHSDYYQGKPKAEQPPKYWFSYRLNKYLEPLAMRHVDGLISVSGDYITTLQERYPRLAAMPCAVITFGVFERDFLIAESNKDRFTPILAAGRINIVYAGRGGKDMHRAITPVFEALKDGLRADPALFKKLHFYFIGTSYAPAGKGQLSIMPLAVRHEVDAQVTEISSRISFYHTLLTLQQADALFVPGSDDPQYTASKIYPYLFSRKPLLAVFHEHSSVVEVIRKCSVNATLISFGDTEKKETIYQTLTAWASGSLPALELTAAIEDYTAENMTRRQTELFNQVLNRQ